ncbi:MAG: hypothetical protein MJY43_04690 [Bacteroidales bacterium]|nr:hypothetical protein [Bacteroidales bacterium]
MAALISDTAFPNEYMTGTPRMRVVSWTTCGWEPTTASTPFDTSHSAIDACLSLWVSEYSSPQ